MLLLAPGWAPSALGVGAGVRGRGGGLAPLVMGPGNPGGVKNIHYLFFGFVKSSWDLGDRAGRACSALAAPGTDGPRSVSQALCPEPRGQIACPWVWEVAWGSRRGEHLCALPAAIAIPEPRSVFPRLGAGGQRARASGRCCPRVIPPTPVPTYTTRAFSGPLSPRQRSLSDKRACTCG